MRCNDAVFGGVLIIFAVAVIAHASTFPSLHGQAYGPDLFPTLISAGLIGSGIALVARGLINRQTEPMFNAHSWAGNRSAQLTLLLMIGSVLVFIVLADTIGFIFLAVPILILLAYRFGVPLFYAAILSIVTTIIIHTLFVRILLVPLPRGLLDSIGA